MVLEGLGCMVAAQGGDAVTVAQVAVSSPRKALQQQIAEVQLDVGEAGSLHVAEEASAWKETAGIAASRVTPGSSAPRSQLGGLLGTVALVAKRGWVTKGEQAW